MSQRLRLIFLVLLTGRCLGQGLTPEQAVARMKPADGFQVHVAASEPQVRQPVAIDFDERGRLWVLQYLQYPNPVGLKRVQVDRYSRTRYDRVPEPPPKGPRGADRLTILEPDPTKPGLLKPKDFVDGLNLASGFAFGHGGVFVLQVPYLLFYPDRDRNDRPDGDPEVLLEGFGMEDAHSVANSLTWGPDGWLYGCQGSTVTARIRGIEFQQGVWRYHPLTRKFELFCEGGGNSWGLDFDRHGHLLYSTNFGPHILLHAAQGGYFWKQFGKHGDLHNRFAYDHIDHAPHANPRGGHVTTGGIVYRGGQFPKEFEGAYLGGDLLGHEVLWHRLLANGSSFRTRLGGVLLAGNDPWFAPCDVCLGPDGCVYVADWHDQRTAHPDPDAEWDRTNGRVFRISHGKPPSLGPFDMGGFTREQLLAELSGPNQWRVRTARRILAQRRDPELILPLRARLEAASTSELALEYLWTLNACGGLTEEYARGLLSNGSAPIRMWAVQLLGDREHLGEKTREALAQLSRAEKETHTRRQLACTAQRVPGNLGMDLVEGLLGHPIDPSDPQMPKLVWWALERHCLSAPEKSVEILSKLKGPIADYLQPRLARRLVAAGKSECDIACLGFAPTLPMLEAMENGWLERQGNSNTQPAPPLIEAWRTAAAREPAATRLLARAGDLDAIATWTSWVEDSKRPATERAKNLTGLTGVASAASVRDLLTRLVSQEIPLQLAVLAAWQRVGEFADANRLIVQYPTSPKPVQARIRPVLLSRKDWAGVLLDAIRLKAIPAGDFSADEISVVATYQDDQLNRQVRAIWGKIQQPTGEERLAEIRRLNNDLRAGKGDITQGKLLFAAKCGTCHKLGGEGGTIGPDLTQANRSDTQFLLASLVDPSNVIRKEYLTHLVETKRGVTHSGIIVSQGAEGLTLVNAKDERNTIPANEIESLSESPVSLMPESLLKDLTPSQLRDLFAYVQFKHEPGAK